MYRYQTFGSRFLAAIIDGIIFSIISTLINNVFGRHYADTIPGTIIYSALFYFYSIFLHYKYGQTLGKKITNVRVVSNSDETKLIGLANSFKRDSIGILFVVFEVIARKFDIENSSFGDYLFLFSSFGWVLAELISMLFNRKRRAIHDFLANSVVINVK